MPEIEQPKSDSLSNAPLQAPQIDSLPKIDSLPVISSPKRIEEASLDLMASLPDVDGYMKFWHQMTDHLYRQMTMAEQAVHIQLFRLSWGHNKPTCVIGLPGLARRTGAAKGTVQTAIAGLVKKGLIRKERTIFGKEREQGVEYYVIPPPSMAKSDRLSKSDRLPDSSTNKEKEIKKDSKGISASPNFQNCPDCHGTGFHYVDEMDRTKGVEKCAHRNLK